jgi:uncharacterized protein YciI
MRLALLGLGCFLAACASSPSRSTENKVTSYDPVFAASVKADERGMRNYVMVILKTGPATNLSEAERAKLFEGHFANIDRLSKAGVLLSAGPFGKNDKQFRGLFLFAVETVEEAKPLVESDPSVAGGLFVYEAYPWYGSAALMDLPAQHARVQKPE